MKLFSYIIDLHEEGFITISPGLIDAYILTNVFLRFIDDICD